MYSIAENEKNHTILSIKELIAIIVVFGFMLYILFPKGDIEELVKSEQDNTNLSINYLESILLYHPDNIDLKILLVKNYRYKGELDKAERLKSELLLTVTDSTIRTQLYEQEYLILKDRYFQFTGSESQKQHLMAQLHKKLFDYYNHLGTKRDYLFFFAESTQINHQELKYTSLKNLMEQRPDLVDYELEKEVYFLASSLGYAEESYQHLSKLLEYPNIDKNLQEGALSLLINRGEYAKAFDIGKQLFLHSEDQEEVIHLFNITLYALQQMSNRDDIKSKIQALVQLYKNNKMLKSDDIYLLIHTLLQSGNTATSSLLTNELFESHWREFNEEVITLAIQALQYNNNLEAALKIAYFAYGKYPSMQWLDAAVRLSSWTGKMDDAVTLSKHGYQIYHDKRYENTILQIATLDTEYHLLGEIYKNRVAEGNQTAVAYVAEYFDYMGEIPEGEEYFADLLKSSPSQEIHKQAITFSYYNRNLDKALKLYQNYQKHYGDDPELLKLVQASAIAQKVYPQAYTYAKALTQIQPLHGLDKQLIDLSWLQKDYQFLHQKLWEHEKKSLIDPSYYYHLIRLEEGLIPKPNIDYLYRRAWEAVHNPSYLMALLYHYMESKNYTEFENVMESIPKNMRPELEKSNSYLILLANFHAQYSTTSKALKYFHKALKNTPNEASLHQAYLWFLIDHQLTKPLGEEITLLRHAPKLQKSVRFPSVVAALTLQKSDLALRWLLPLLHEEKERFEYQLLHANILELQDRSAGAQKIRQALFKQMEDAIREKPQLLDDKHFARNYLRMVIFYKFPYAKKALYFERFKSLFKPEEFNEITLGWHTFSQSTDRVHYLANKHNFSRPWLDIYLAMSLDNLTQKAKLLKAYTPILPFRDRVTASVHIGDRAGAYTLAFQGLEDNSRDVNLFKIYNEMINQEYPSYSIAREFKQLSPHIRRWETEASSRWHLYKGISTKFTVRRRYYDDDKHPNVTDNSLVLSLQNSDQKLTWDWSVAKHFSRENMISSSLKISYRDDPFTFGVDTAYCRRTEVTPHLQLDTFEDKVRLSATFRLTQREQLGMSYEKKRYTQENQNIIGSSQQLQFSYQHIFKFGYPDLQWNNYLNINQYHFTPRGFAWLKDFKEIGTQLSFGALTQHQLNRSWRPYGSLAVSVNDQSNRGHQAISFSNLQNLGASLSIGLTGMVNRQDQFNLLLNYSKGIGLINDASYGLSLDYRF